MSNDNKRINKHSNAPLSVSPPHEELAPRKERDRWVESVTGIVLALVALSVFWPRPSVDLTPPTINGDPYSAGFTVTNDTFIVPLRDVGIGFSICQSASEPIQFDPNRHCDTESLLKITTPEWSHQHLSHNEKFGVSFGQVIPLSGNARLTGADVAVQVDYQWWFFPLQFHKSFRFVTKKDADGNLQWHSRPVEP
jgi:hypothetical protein